MNFFEDILFLSFFVMISSGTKKGSKMLFPGNFCLITVNPLQVKVHALQFFMENILRS